MIDILTGLQYGSEGKGKFAGWIARLYDVAVRTGAPNAGHTVIDDGGNKFVFRHLPSLASNPHIKSYIGAGGLILEDVLNKEFDQFTSFEPELRIDRNAGIITEHDIEEERSATLQHKIGSTQEGVGSAQARKVRRNGFTLASEKFTGTINVSQAVRRHLENGENVMLEGTQGFGLCLNHGDYPYVTSRDILSASLLSDAGLPPNKVRHIFGVMRTYPIRVAGNSGDTGGKELSWAEVADRSGYKEEEITERTTVTKKVRRVFEIDWTMVKEAVDMNGTTGIFLAFADYLDKDIRGAKDINEDLSPEARGKLLHFIAKVENETGIPVLAVSTGPRNDETITLPAWEKIEASLRGEAVNV